MTTRYGLLLILWGLLACQTPPTKLYEEHAGSHRESTEKIAEKIEQPIQITKQTVVIDARTPFNFVMAHIPGAINMDWQEFSEKDPTLRGLLSADLFFHARRLARLGIGPDSEVVVVGEGPDGEGEEGRVAWTLYYLGIKNVRFAGASYFSQIKWVNTDATPPRAAVPVWKPILHADILSDKASLLKAASGAEAGYFKKGKLDVRPLSERSEVVLDVRSADEFSGREGLGKEHELPGFGAINLEWKEFFNQQGRLRFSAQQQLQKLGIQREHRIVVISNKGVRSAAVTMALLDFGYKAANFAGGYQALIANNLK